MGRTYTPLRVKRVRCPTPTELATASDQGGSQESAASTVVLPYSVSFDDLMRALEELESRTLEAHELALQLRADLRQLLRQRSGVN